MNINYGIHYVHRDFGLKVNFRTILKMMVMHECCNSYTFNDELLRTRSISFTSYAINIRKILKFKAVLGTP